MNITKEMIQAGASAMNGILGLSREEAAQFVLTAALRHAEPCEPVAVKAFGLGDRVQKKGGSSWHGRIVGFYSTELTPVGYCVESEREHGSVQIYPETALEFAPDPHDWQGGSDD